MYQYLLPQYLDWKTCRKGSMEKRDGHNSPPVVHVVPPHPCYLVVRQAIATQQAAVGGFAQLIDSSMCFSRLKKALPSALSLSLVFAASCLSLVTGDDVPYMPYRTFATPSTSGTLIPLELRTELRTRFRVSFFCLDLAILEES